MSPSRVFGRLTLLGRGPLAISWRLASGWPAVCLFGKQCLHLGCFQKSKFNQSLFSWLLHAKNGWNSDHLLNISALGATQPQFVPIINRFRLADFVGIAFYAVPTNCTIRRRFGGVCFAFIEETNRIKRNMMFIQIFGSWRHSNVTRHVCLKHRLLNWPQTQTSV